MDFVSLDVETANNASGSICSIGLARFSNGSLVDKYYSLVCPPEEFGEFSAFCIQVHGITPETVEDKPTYREQHAAIDSFIDGQLLVAHNAPFDSRHLRAIMGFNGYEYGHEFACTLSLARRMLHLPNYKLDTVCDYLDIMLDNYHNALDDAIACGNIFACLTG